MNTSEYEAALISAAPTKKEAKAKRKDQYSNFNRWMANMSHHPDTISGSMNIPARAAMDAYDEDDDEPWDRDPKKEAHFTSIKQAFKQLYLTTSKADTLDQLYTKITEDIAKLEKRANDVPFDPTSLLSSGLSSATSLLGKGLNIGATAAIGGPMVLGGLGGLLLAMHQSNPDLEGIKKDDLKAEYMRLAEQAKRNRTFNVLQDKYPGAVLKLN